MMLMKILTVLSIAVALSQSTSDQNSYPRNASSRIIGGWPAADKQFPFAVYFDIEKKVQSFVCGGSLIHHQWVLTAAHCLSDALSVQVRLGSNNIYNPEEIRNSETFFMHPLFECSNSENDIGLIYFREQVELSENIQIIRIAPKNFPDPVGEVAVTCGWGQTTSFGNTSIILNFIQVRIIANAECKKDHYDYSIDKSICTIGEGGTCYGDSGSPLVVTDPNDNTPIVIGITSFGSENCSVTISSVFTKPQLYHDWILETMTNVIDQDNYFEHV